MNRRAFVLHVPKELSGEEEAGIREGIQRFFADVGLTGYKLLILDGGFHLSEILPTEELDAGRLQEIDHV